MTGCGRARKAGEDLQLLWGRTGLSETDIVNRAIALHEFINAQLHAGNDLLVRDQETERDSASPVPMTRSWALRIARRLPRAPALISRSASANPFRRR
jgi:hypothetical protein